MSAQVPVSVWLLLHVTVLQSQLAGLCQATCIQMDVPMLPSNLPSRHITWLSCKYDYLQCLQGIIKSLFWSPFKCIISIKVICCSDYHFISTKRKKKDAKRTCKLYMIQWTFCFKWNIQISFEKAWFGCRSELSFPYSTSSLHFSEDWVPFYGFPSLV